MNMLEQAREWLMDCSPSKRLERMIRKWEPVLVFEVVRDNYAGGLDQFARDGTGLREPCGVHEDEQRLEREIAATIVTVPELWRE